MLLNNQTHRACNTKPEPSVKCGLWRQPVHARPAEVINGAAQRGLLIMGRAFVNGVYSE